MPGNMTSDVQKLWDDSSGRAVSQDDLEAAKAARDATDAQVHANEAQSHLLRQELADTQLYAPSESIVRSRILEPGDMSSPIKPVLSLAVIDPKWVRAYVSEPDLGEGASGNEGDGRGRQLSTAPASTAGSVSFRRKRSSRPSRSRPRNCGRASSTKFACS